MPAGCLPLRRFAKICSRRMGVTWPLPEREMLFAHLKRILRLGRLRLRGAQDEFTLAATAQNLRRLAKFVARPPPPQPMACVA
jgi:hypothetical protein